jgi:hypothetical protein
MNLINFGPGKPGKTREFDFKKGVGTLINKLTSFCRKT